MTIEITIENKEKKEGKRYLSMEEAAKISPYQKDYLSLLCRKKELRAEKIGRAWYTTQDWLKNYLKEKKPDFVIPQNDSSFENRSKKNRPKIFLAGLIVLIIIFGMIAYIFLKISSQVKKIEENKKDNFISEEILKIPNEDGKFEVYEVGKIKVGGEEIIEK